CARQCCYYDDFLDYFDFW
nr:immunoglobulin heavy chain junction region [Macaca mulatta]MOX58697.1 immunoglobulin heavy chain junction region [Macaca mulatta]MOX58832.1 immunoglobulin heavy chain junction region [Macaca mulatta]MOX59110.1 immunoglobulin heavy chain junction region [Macaca mulatta]MOX59249.1 immunoglobulin heavy chain junction region [Macaca mulatta]